VGNWLVRFLFTQAGPIYAGTSEFNNIAERMLGMPREGPMDFTFTDDRC
jgi:hypothetical protein